MKLIKSTGLACPSCKIPMTPSALVCRDCDLTVQGHFEQSPWVALSEDQLRFVQLFIHCEGRIRDMEKALGVSYPTVKAQLSEVKAQLSQPMTSTEESRKSTESKATASTTTSSKSAASKSAASKAGSPKTTMPKPPASNPAGTNPIAVQPVAASTEAILEQLKNQTISYEEALELLRSKH